jgi:GDPmannose 4,6-dehydratase
MKTALITGISGQDGMYLSELLVKKNYSVHGIVKSLSSDKKVSENKGNILSSVSIHECDICDFSSIEKVICEVKPDEIYHLASSVEPLVIKNEELSIFEVNFIPGIHILNAVKINLPKAKVYLAGSSLMFGNTSTSMQSEKTPMRPTTPYGIAKVALFNFMEMYRHVYDIYICMGILYNHESPRRNEKFLPKKITKAAARIKAGKQSELTLGDLSIYRDWSYAGDIVKSMWLMLQSETPSDYVVGSGVLHTPEDILNIAFRAVGLDWKKYVKVDNKFYRSVEYTNLCADITKIHSDLNWSPLVKFEELISLMVQEDIKFEGFYD